MRAVKLIQQSTGICSFILLFFSASILYSQQIAFPGAEGYGKYTTGGRGGKVIEVTNLNSSGTGSFAAAIAQSGARTVVFRVSGTITGNFSINRSDITIAGQTAPGDGICIKGNLSTNANNIIIRYIRVRYDPSKGENDALGGRYKENIIFDHVSASWSTDEVLTLYHNKNTTVQWCIISEGCEKFINGVPQGHRFGGIWGNDYGTWHHNLLAHNDSRNPRWAGGTGYNDYRNNVLYNWGYQSCYGGEANQRGDSRYNFSTINIVANYYKPGPATGPKDRIAQPSAGSASDKGSWYVDDNYVDGYPGVTADNWQGVDGSSYIKLSAPWPAMAITQQTAETAYKLVLADVGCSLPKRDSVDADIIDDVLHGIAKYGNHGIIDTPSDVGGWPVLNSLPAPPDFDHDGMPNDWELANGLDSTDAEDRNIVGADGYTNLENYLNSLCFRSDYLPAPGNLKALSTSNEEIILNWQEAALNENGFIIERSENDTLSFTEVGIAAADDTSFTDDGLSSLTTYYYRIRAFHDSARSIYSNYTSAKTAYPDGRPLEPDNSFPVNNSENVRINSKLSWCNAAAATSYDVYLGTTEEPESIGNQTSNIFDPEGLQDSTRYYWRIDAVNSFGTTTGNLWTFFTENLKDTIVGHWPLDVKSSSARDESGNANNAYLMNMVSSNWIDDGISGKALSFDGINDHLFVYNDDAIGFNVLGFTISFWIRQSVNNKKMPWISKAEFDGETWGTRYELYHAANGTVNFLVNDGTTQSSIQASNSNYITGAWVMVSAVRDKKNQKLKLYANDKLIAEEEDSTWDLTESANLYFGTNAQTSEFFKGDMDKIVMFNYALDSTEIKDLYLNTITSISSKSEPNLPITFDIKNYPNPFNSTTIFRYSIPNSGIVNLSLYNTRGQKITVLLNENKTAGHYTISFNASHLSSGIYFYRIQTGGKIINKKMILIK